MLRFMGHIFDVSINKRSGVASNGPQSLKWIEERSPYSVNNFDDFWEFKPKGYNKYYFIDSYRFGTGTGKNSGTLDLSNYEIVLSLKDDGYEELDGLWMQVGDQNMLGEKSVDGRSYSFDLSKNGVPKYLSSDDHYPDNLSSRSFTFFEYPENQSDENYFGKNNIVVTVGPDAYTGFNGFTKIPSSQLRKWGQLQFSVGIGPKTYNVKVGALADQLLRQTKRKPINFQFDKQLDASKVKATQAIIYQEVGKGYGDDEGWGTFMLDWNQPISVSGVKQDPGEALIDGAKQRDMFLPNEPDSVSGFGQFFNSMLEISSTYPSKKTSSYGTTPSSSIQGMTFLNPPARKMGGVTVNTPYVEHVRANTWWDQDYSSKTSITKNSSIYKTRLTAALARATQNELPRNVPTKAASQIFDNQIIGGWIYQSDAIEDGTFRGLSGRNFYHVNDDSIKLLNGGQQFIQNTIHQGKAGSPMSYGYGASSNNVDGTRVEGLYIHRITQPYGRNASSDNPDPTDGLFNLKWTFENDHSYGYDSKFDNIYIPSMRQQKPGIDIESNALLSMGTFQTKNWWDGSKGESGDYSLGGFKINNSNSDIDIKYDLRVPQQFSSSLKDVPPNSQNEIIYASSDPVNIIVRGASCPNIANDC